MSTTPAPEFTTYDPPAIFREEMRDHALVTRLGGSRVLEAALRAGRIFETREDLIAAGYDPDTRRTVATD